MAWIVRSRPPLAEPPAESPSTMKISVVALFAGAVPELAGQVRVAQRAFAAGQLARLARRFARGGRLDGLVQDALRLRRMLFEVMAQLLVDHHLHEAADLRIAQAHLRLRLEVRVGQLDRDHRGQPLAQVVAGGRLALFQKTVVSCVGVHRPRQRRAEARQMRAPVDVADVVREDEHVLVVPVVVLHRHLAAQARLGSSAHVDDVVVQDVLAFVEVFDEGLDPFGEVESSFFLRVVAEGDLDVRVEVRHSRIRLRAYRS